METPMVRDRGKLPGRIKTGPCCIGGAGGSDQAGGG